MNLVKDGKDCFQLVKTHMLSDGGSFLSRMGGSDTEAVVAFFFDQNQPGSDYGNTLNHLGRVRRYNGYYDKSEQHANFIKYCAYMLELYSKNPLTGLSGPPWTHIYFPDLIVQKHAKVAYDLTWYTNLMEAISMSQPDLTIIPYRWFENFFDGQFTLFRLLSEILNNKRVLVVSPFAESIEANFHNKSLFFKDYQYPEFILKTYNAPITYANLADNSYPETDWFATVSRMQNDISKLKFDVALLSCGSYAMPLGTYIRDVLGRKAIYVGGVLQMYFGIMGRRYEENSFTNQINKSVFIYPIETKYYFDQVESAKNSLVEAFGAYF